MSESNALLQKLGSVPTFNAGGAVQVNPLAAIQAGNQAATSEFEARAWQAKQAAGNAFLQSIDPATGQPNQAQLLRNLQANPTSALAAQSSAQSGQTLDQETYDLHNKRLTGMMSAGGQLIADNPNGVPPDAMNAIIDHRLQIGLITPEIAQQLHAQVSSDPVKNTQFLLQGMTSNLSAQSALEAVRPSTGTINTGQGTTGFQSPPRVASTATQGTVTPVGTPVPTGLPSVSDMLKQVGQPITDPKQAAALGVPVGTTVDVPMIQRWIDQGALPLVRGNIPGATTPAGGPSAAPPPPPGGTTQRPAAPPPGTTPPATDGGAGPFKPVVSAQPPGAQQAAEKTAGGAAEAGNAIMARADQVPTNKSNYANMLDDISKLPSMGPGTERETYINSLVQKWTGKNWGTMTPDQIRAANSFSKLANIAVGQQLAAIGGTDARQQLFMGSNPKLDLSKLSNEALVHMLQGNEDAIGAKARAWQDWQKAGNGPQSFYQFQDDFNHHFDPRVFQQQYYGADELATLRKRMTHPDGSLTGEGEKFKEDTTYARSHGWIQ
jgi:hypothetical protein